MAFIEGRVIRSNNAPLSLDVKRAKRQRLGFVLDHATREQSTWTKNAHSAYVTSFERWAAQTLD